MGNALTLCIGLLPKNKFFEIIEPSREGSVKVSLLASHFRHILALLHLDIFTDRPWHLLADRVRHLNDSKCENSTDTQYSERESKAYHRANFVGQSNAFSFGFLPALGSYKQWGNENNKP